MCQFTGLTDKNGTEIYEGDVVRVLYSGWISQHLGTEKQKAMSLEEYLVDISHNDTVVFDRCGFTLKQGSIHVGKHGQIEVIGNIHENPELLEDNPNDHK